MKNICLVLFLLIFGCVSEEEKQERQEAAFDLTGSYRSQAINGNGLDFEIDIVNEKGTHDILVTLRRDNFPQAERNFLQTQGFDPDQVFDYFGTSFQLGRGYHPAFSGGENISKNFGASSEFRVCSDYYKNEVDENNKYRIYYCLSAEVTKTTKIMSGSLSLHWHRTITTITADGDKSYSYSGDLKDYSFSLNTDMIFYRQYLGNWSGEVTTSPFSEFNANYIKKITLEELEEGTIFGVVPQKKTIIYKNQRFEYAPSESQDQIAYLKDSSFPAIHMMYKGPSDQRIILFAQIWSLGDLTGSFIYENDTEIIELAVINYKKVH